MAFPRAPLPRASVGGLRSIAGVLAAAAILSAVLYSLPAVAGTVFKGSGASFPYPIYIRWIRDFSAERGAEGKEIRIVYRATGSGAGIRAFTGGTVDFAGSDAPMSEKELASVKRGTVALPVTAGSIVLAYNLKGVEDLKLPRDVYVGIFLGQISRWNHPKIVTANPGVALPDIPITVVVRSDASGSSHIFTSHLSAISLDFARKTGASRQPKWPSPKNVIKVPGNEGVAARVKRTRGAIGYMEHQFAALVEMPVAQLQNRAGYFVSAGPRSGAAALADIEFSPGKLPGSGAPNLFAQVDDPQGPHAYPISGFSWLLFYASSKDGQKAAILRQLVDYILSDKAQREAAEHHYIPLPPEVRRRAREAARYIR